MDPSIVMAQLLERQAKDPDAGQQLLQLLQDPFSGQVSA